MTRDSNENEPLDLYLNNTNLVKSIAFKLLNRIPEDLPAQELFLAGFAGLYQSAKNYNPTDGASFELYAGIRVRGSMLDKIREFNVESSSDDDLPIFEEGDHHDDRATTAIVMSNFKKPKDTNNANLVVLLQGAEIWNEWVAEQRNDFEANLSGVCISGEKNLIGVDLSRADLRGALIDGADLSNSDLRGADCSRASLASVNLRRARLVGAILGNAVLRNSKLNNASLSFSQLNGVDFTGADLSDADLNGADLSGAVLKNVKLCRADLSGVNFAYADLSGADLSDANLNQSYLKGTIIVDTILANVVGLDNCIHRGPSTLDFRTLEKSVKMPRSFLSGCGLPESLISYLPSLLQQSISFYSCFISYSHEDKIFAQRLHDHLQNRGIRCWLDEHQLLPGDDIYKQVDEGINLWDKVILCASESALTSWWVDNEIESAFRKEQLLMKERGKKVWSLIPLNLDGFLFSGEWGSGKANQVNSRLAADFTGWEKDSKIFEQAFENVVKALNTNNTGRLPIPEPKL